MFLGLSDLDGITRISSSFFSNLAPEIVSERETELWWGLLLPDARLVQIWSLWGVSQEEEEEEEAKRVRFLDLFDPRLGPTPDSFLCLWYSRQPFYSCCFLVPSACNLNWV